MTIPCTNTDWLPPEDTRCEGPQIHMQYDRLPEPEDLTRYTDHELRMMQQSASGLARCALTEVLKLREAIGRIVSEHAG